MNSPPAKHKNILLLSAGSKVAIARIAKQSAKRRGATLHISDTQGNVPSAHIADRFTKLPPHSESNWAKTLLDFCLESKIGLIIPTRHIELTSLSELSPQLRKQGTAVSLSGAKTLQICIHKSNTYRFLKQHDIPTPKTFSPKNPPTQVPYPLIAKPESGASSTGIKRVTSGSQLQHISEDWILQEEAKGIEFTTNLYIDQRGEALCAIPHQRIATESGEVVQARTRRITALIELCETIAKRLPDAQGIINIQAFYDQSSQTIKIIEINPRIGGGYPLCDAAKGHYIEWLCQEHLDKKTPTRFDVWTENLLMMRYREAIFSL